jgi:hypothetical protein
MKDEELKRIEEMLEEIARRIERIQNKYDK